MKKLIEILKESIGKEDDFMAALAQNRDYCWQREYPVAVVHEARRVKENEIKERLQEKAFFNEAGYTPSSWSADRIEELKSLAPQYVKSVSVLVHKGNPHGFFLFQEKRARDYWKKVSDDGSFVATVEYSRYASGSDICQIEADLRDLMRSSKEVPSLKEIGYIWVVEAPMDLELDRVLAHYYQKDWMMVIGKQKIVYIGWHERLGSVDMRHFVCPPKPKRRDNNA